MAKHGIKTLVFVVLLLAGAVVLNKFATHHPMQWDITQNASNSLDSSSIDVLRLLKGEVKLTVFSSGRNAKGADIRKLIHDFVALYQRYKPDISLVFVDPMLHPEQARNANIQATGEMLVEYAGRGETLSMLSEPSLTGALLRLAHNEEKLLMYVDGHGERKLDGIANRDLGEFGKRLQRNGYRIGSLNLTVAQDVPTNVTTLVIAQPQVDLLPGETAKLLRYVDSGGNLLWLVDDEPLHGLEPLAEKLMLRLPPGTVVDPAAEEMRAPANWAIATEYPPHAVTHDFNLITVFPFARALGWKESKEWQHSALVEVAHRGWVSTSKTQEIMPLPPPGGVEPSGAEGEAEQLLPQLAGSTSNVSQLRFDKNRDVPGPAVVALALQRNIDSREQRIIVVGSGSFVANAYSGNAGNLDLGVNMVNWLANEDRFISIRPHATKDSLINLNKTQLSLISIGLVIVLPLLLVLVGSTLWWRRRR